MQPFSYKKINLKMLWDGSHFIPALVCWYAFTDRKRGIKVWMCVSYLNIPLKMAIFIIALNTYLFMYSCISYNSIFATMHFSFFIVFNLHIIVWDTYILRYALILYFCILLCFYCFYMNFCNCQQWRNKDIQSINHWTTVSLNQSALSLWIYQFGHWLITVSKPIYHNCSMGYIVRVWLVKIIHLLGMNILLTF